MLCAGDMQDVITVQQATNQRQPNGEVVPVWSNVVANLRAEVKPIRGQQLVILRAALSELSLRVRIKYRTGINTEMRILWRSDPYYISEVIPGGFRNKTELTLMCRGPATDA